MTGTRLPEADSGTGWPSTFPPPSGNWHADAGNPATRLMPEQAVQIRNDAGFTGYSGSFPPPGHGWHLYLVTVYALDTASLPVAPGYPGRPGRLPALAAHAGKSIPRLLRPGTGKITCTGENHRFYRASGLAALSGAHPGCPVPQPFQHPVTVPAPATSGRTISARPWRRSPIAKLARYPQ